jgi:hypothetical protein
MAFDLLWICRKVGANRRRVNWSRDYVVMAHHRSVISIFQNVEMLSAYLMSCNIMENADSFKIIQITNNNMIVDYHNELWC